MKKYGLYRSSSYVICLLLVVILSGCGKFQGETSAGRSVEFDVRGLIISYFAADLGSVRFIQSTSDLQLWLPYGIFSYNMLFPDAPFSRFYGIIFLNNFAYGKVGDTYYGFLNQVETTPLVNWSARKVSDDEPTLFPDFWDKAAAEGSEEEDPYSGNNTPVTAAVLTLTEEQDRNLVKIEGLHVNAGSTEYYAVDLAAPAYVTAITRSADCGVQTRPIPRLLDCSGTPITNPLLRCFNSGSKGTLVPAGRFLVEVSSTLPPPSFVSYNLVVLAFPAELEK